MIPLLIVSFQGTLLILERGRGTTVKWNGLKGTGDWNTLRIRESISMCL